MPFSVPSALQLLIYSRQPLIASRRYLNGIDATAAYVRMTLSVMTDMRYFMLILLILVVGNVRRLCSVPPAGSTRLTCAAVLNRRSC